MNKDVLLVSFSAFFADLGYQAALVIFPVFLVLTLGAPVSYFGIANAIAFGIGSFFGYVGGWMADKFSDRKVAIVGNSLIPLISLMGLASSPVTAVALFSGGWWARNFRTPSRRSMLVEATTAKTRGQVFGFLHLLDIGGGMLSVVFVLVFIYFGLSYQKILLLTVLPLIISTALLFPTSESGRQVKKVVAAVKTATKKVRISGSTYKGILAATALYGFSSYSLGFPILTIAKSSSPVLGIASYGVYLGVSAITGYVIGTIWKKDQVKHLSIFGYVLSGLGTLFLGVGYLVNSGVWFFYLAVAILGFGLGVIETLEPTLISFIKSEKDIGKGMGALAAWRSFGIFFANLIMGILYVLNPFDSYMYATVVSVFAGILLLRMGKGFEV